MPCCYTRGLSVFEELWLQNRDRESQILGERKTGEGTGPVKKRGWAGAKQESLRLKSKLKVVKKKNCCRWVEITVPHSSVAFLIFISFQPSVHPSLRLFLHHHPARAACFDESRTWIHLPRWALRKQTGWYGRVFCRHSSSKAKWVLSCWETISLVRFSAEITTRYQQTNYPHWSARLGVPAKQVINSLPETW